MWNQTETLNIDRCGNCQYRLALRRPTPKSPASAWRCRRCRALFLASAQERDGKPFSAGTRAECYFDVICDLVSDTLEETREISEQDVLRLRECLQEDAGERPNARKHARHAIVAPVTVLALSSDLRVIGEPLGAIAVNVSAGGLAIIHSRPIEEPYFAVDFSRGGAALTPVVLKKLRSREVGDAFEIAGKFVSRIEN